MLQDLPDVLVIPPDLRFHLLYPVPSLFGVSCGQGGVEKGVDTAKMICGALFEVPLPESGAFDQHICVIHASHAEHLPQRCRCDRMFRIDLDIGNSHMISICDLRKDLI